MKSDQTRPSVENMSPQKTAAVCQALETPSTASLHSPALGSTPCRPGTQPSSRHQHQDALRDPLSHSQNPRAIARRCLRSQNSHAPSHDTNSMSSSQHSQTAACVLHALSQSLHHPTKTNQQDSLRVDADTDWFHARVDSSSQHSLRTRVTSEHRQAIAVPLRLNNCALH